MQKLIFTSLITLLFQLNLSACDACGCSISGNGLGILGTFRNNAVGLSWQSVRFHGTPDHGFSGHGNYVIKATVYGSEEGEGEQSEELKFHVHQ